MPHAKNWKGRPNETQDGKPLWKQIHVKVIVGKKLMRHDFRAPAQRGYTEQDIENTLENIIEHLDAKFPYIDFRMVRLAPNAINFIATGNRERPETLAREGCERG